MRIKIFYSIPIVLLFCLNIVHGQVLGTWKQRADFGGSGRYDAMAFAIGNKGYVGLGTDGGGGSYFGDIWEYDTQTDVWTQKANFEGGPRKSSTAFAIGGKGYVCFGADGMNYKNDCWEYNPLINTWLQKNDFPATGRGNSVGFVINNKGYIGTGIGIGNITLKDFWEYAPGTDTWVQKTSLPGDARCAAIGFSISDKGYIGCGNTQISGSNFKNDFWEYNPLNNSWTQKANMGDRPKCYSVAFVIDSLGYVVSGYDGQRYDNMVWEYHPGSNKWIQKPSYAGTEVYHATCFVAGNKGYIATGYSGPFNKSNMPKDFWEYRPYEISTWQPRNDIQQLKRMAAATFTIGTSAYMCTGFDSTGQKKDVWEYNSVTNTWTQKADLGGVRRNGAVGFAIAGFGYIGLGFDSFELRNDCWKYNPVLNTWMPTTNFAGAARYNAVSFVINNKAYVGTGYDDIGSRKDFWQFDPVSEQWTSVANMPGAGRANAVAFAINDKGYVATGDDGSKSNNCYAYHAPTNVWTQVGSILSSGRVNAMAFSVNNKGYVAAGWDNNDKRNDIWEYDPDIRLWKRAGTLPGGVRQYATAFTIGHKAYMGGGYLDTSYYGDFWTYVPQKLSIQSLAVGSLCRKDSLGLSYWNEYESQLINIELSDRFGNFGSDKIVLSSAFKAPGYYTEKVKLPDTVSIGSNYKIRLTSAKDTSNSSSVINIQGVSSQLQANKTAICFGDSIQLSVANIPANSYMWFKNDTLLPGVNKSSYKINSAGDYRVFVADTNGCNDTSNKINIQVHSLPVTSAITGDTGVFNKKIKEYSVILNVGSNYQWSIIGGVKLSGGNTNSILVEWMQVGNGSIKVVETNANGCKGDTVIKNITIAAIPDTLSLSADTLYFTSKSDSKTVSLVCNTTWTIEDTTSWITLNAASGNLNAVFNVTVQPNTTAQQRTASISISTMNISRNLVVVQDVQTGMAAIEAKRNISIHPNPAHSIIRVQGLTEPIILCDVLGNTIMQIDTDGDVDISAFKQGIYFIRSGKATQKLIKY